MISKVMSVFVAIILFFTSIISGIEGKFRKSDVVILYTNDVHCGVTDKIGYSGLKAYKNKMESENKNVTLVDVGDCTQGGFIGSISKGEYIIDIMNYVGYDYAILGNHEFDYGIDQLAKNIAAADFRYLGCNLTYSGSGESLLSDIADYAIEDYGDVQVAFIGVTTPASITSSTPVYFQDENGNFIYGFEESLTKSVQECAAKARMKGADYVVALTHLGDDKNHSPYSSVELIEGTAGIDAVLDGHDHNTIESRVVKNKNGDDVILSSTGTKLENIGKLVITKDGDVSTELVNDFDEKDEATTSYIDAINEKATASMKQVIGKSEIDLSIYDEDGVRVSRNRETAIGNILADSYRIMLGADIGIINGGGIRADIKAGELTYVDIYNVNPFGDHMVVIEVTGQQIADALEWTSQNAQSEYKDGSKPIGEMGSFAHVSGLKYTIDTSIPSSVTSDENGMFVSIEGERRVKDILVLQNGEYVPIEMDKTYTIAGSDHVLTQNGGGQTAFDGAKVINEDGPLDYEVFVNYITDILGGTITAEDAKTEGRITIK